MTVPKIPPPSAPMGPAVAARPPMFRSLGIATTGLDAQRLRMDVAAQNIANADVTRTAEGGPYRRRVVELTSATEGQFTNALREAGGLQAAAVAEPARPARVAGAVGADDQFGVAVRGITEDRSEGPRVYEPGHPDADADGYVTYPNVRLTDELLEMMDARRLFEANATVFQVAKAMLRKAIEI